MTEYTKVHKFWIEYKYSEKFKKFFAKNFDKTTEYYWLYNSRWNIEFYENKKIGVLYIETVNDPGLMKDIEKLKEFPRVRYEKLDADRFYKLPSIGNLQEIFPNGRESENSSYISCKYLYYLANINFVDYGLKTRIYLLKFLGEKEEYVTAESFKDNRGFGTESTANACVCIKATFYNNYNDRLASCKLQSIYIKE